MDRESDATRDVVLVPPEFMEDMVEEFSLVVVVFSMVGYYMIKVEAIIPSGFRDC